MSPGERAGFELELRESVELRAELEAYKNIIASVGELGNVQVDERYFNGILPGFRKMGGTAEKKNYHPAYSFAGAVATIIILFLMLPVGNMDFGDRLNNFTGPDISEYLLGYGDQQSASAIPDNYPDNYDTLIESALDNTLSAELNPELSAAVVNDVDFNSLVQTINNKEADQIYAAMINKKIF